jgi:hypothetical protein
MRRTARMAALALLSLLPVLSVAAPKRPPRRVPAQAAQGVHSPRPLPGRAKATAMCSPTGDPGWSATGSMGTPRAYFTATLLQNGKVLVAGGYDETAVMSTCEIYDPATETWSGTAPLNSGRESATATLLRNGKVLLAGGDDGNGTSLSSTEIFDPGLGTWTQLTGAGSHLSEGRTWHTATLLPDGRVLVVGGYGNTTTLNSAEIYDPDTGMWTSTDHMATARGSHTATLLPDGTVLVVGGDNDSANSLASAERYSPNGSGNKWTSAGTMTNGDRANHTATLLPEGEVLVAGGFGCVVHDECVYGEVATCELYSPAGSTWSDIASMNVARSFHTATLLPNGKVLVAGSENAPEELARWETFDPDEGNWSPVPAGSLAYSRRGHVATLLPYGEVLVEGGEYSYYEGDDVFNAVQSSAELYTPELGGPYLGGQPLLDPIDCSGGSCLVATGSVFQGISGGSGGNGGQNSATNYPLFQVQPDVDGIPGGTRTYLLSDPVHPWSNSYFRSTLIPCTIAPGDYWVSIVANGIASDPRRITINAAPSTGTTPADPAPVCAGSTANLTVSATGAGLSYQWYQGTAPDTTTPVGTNLDTFTTDPLSSTASYWVRVLGACSAAADSRTATVEVMPVPEAPLQPTFSAVTKTTLTVHWTAVSGAASYDVWRASGEACASPSKITGSPVTGTSYDDTGLSCDTPYSYFVTANNGCGASAKGGCAPVTTFICPPGETAPGNGGLSTAQQWTDKTAQSWLANDAATSYTLYRGIQADLPQLLNGSVDSCTKYIGAATSTDTINEDPTGLAGGFYWYLVTGSNAGGEGSAGNATAGERIVNSSGDCP